MAKGQMPASSAKVVEEVKAPEIEGSKVVSQPSITLVVVSKKEVVYEAVKMEDGTTVQFPGTRQTNRSISLDEGKMEATVRFDFRNGSVRTISSAGLSKEVILRLLAHGLSQKVGDNFAGTKDVDDIVLETDAMMEQLKAGNWGAIREAGDSMSGASVIIRAICEVKDRTADQVKKYLSDVLEAAKARGEKLTRQMLYTSIRSITSKTGVVIARMEREKAEKTCTVNSDDLLDKMG